MTLHIAHQGRRRHLAPGIPALAGLLFVFCAIASVEVASCGAQEREAPSATLDRDAILAELADVISTSISRADTRHPVFHGCFDWHSAVHGHWAILRIARVTGGHDDLAQAVVSALESDRMAMEAESLRRRRRFELPYGRAWFLRLAVEYDTWCAEQNRPAGERMTSMPDEVAQSLLDYYEQRVPSPATREYANDSWALMQLHAHLTGRGDAERSAIVTQLVRADFVETREPLRFSLDFERPDFFSIFGNWGYLLAHTQDDATVNAFLNEQPVTDEELRPVDPLLRGAHHLGINWSRAWALRALSRTVSDDKMQERLEEAYWQHLNTGWKHHQEHVGNYAAYDHWVPQFAVYALTE